MSGIDWSSVLLPETPILEIFVRGTLTYLGLFVILRSILKREPGAVGVTDILVIVLIADAAQNAMADDYVSITDGLLLVATIVLWSLALDWLGYHIPLIGRFVHPPPLELVREGVENRRNMGRELITHEELMTQLRAHGIDELSEVRRAYMEGNGQITVLRADEQRNGKAKRRVIA